LWLAGEPMAELCREFGISRKTGYKIFDRQKECGVQGLPAVCSPASLSGLTRCNPHAREIGKDRSGV
jgi:hypothetical protein